MKKASECCRIIACADSETVEAWIRERTKFPDDDEMGEVLVGEAAERAIMADLFPAVQRFEHMLAEEDPPDGWQEDAKAALSPDTYKALAEAGWWTDLAQMAEDGLVGVIRMADGELRPFRTIDVATGIDTAEMMGRVLGGYEPPTQETDDE